MTCCVDKVTVNLPFLSFYYLLKFYCFSSGDVESTEPTKMLMRIADHVDNGSPVVREWFVSSRQEVLDMLSEEKEIEKARKEMQNTSQVLERSLDIKTAYTLY